MLVTKGSTARLPLLPSRWNKHFRARDRHSGWVAESRIDAERDAGSRLLRLGSASLVLNAAAGVSPIPLVVYGADTLQQIDWCKSQVTVRPDVNGDCLFRPASVECCVNIQPNGLRAIS